MEVSKCNSILLFLLLLVNCVAPGQLASHHASDHDKRCEEITVPMCRNIGYNTTSMPNQFHHETQDEAGLEGKSMASPSFYQQEHIVWLRFGCLKVVL